MVEKGKLKLHDVLFGSGSHETGMLQCRRFIYVEIGYDVIGQFRNKLPEMDEGLRNPNTHIHTQT